ncbi:MAG: SIS domain-containing protein [Gammaproteobacteria bacterium SHHR-1]|uniref:SIS domain-containing protein n=1 Tax=Magnetovirga frankeli TaxID=947516 RepID=UPI00129329AD|nr:SIS domain-containing protein [gamma proteobacterium SS-5]
MSLSERIEQLFVSQREAQQNNQARLAGPLRAAAELIFGQIIQGHRLLACGNGGGAGLAQILAAQMLYCFEQERPGLPALSLNGDCATLTAIASGDSLDEVYARQVTALGQPGDLLLVISPKREVINLMRAVQEAQAREMRVIALTGSEGTQGGELSALLGAEDIELCLSSAQDARILEGQLFVIHCLCDLIDRQLLGH